MSRPPPIRRPDLPPVMDYADAIAIRRCARGEAQPDEQHRAMAWIIAICRTYNPVFYEDSVRLSDFASGMRHIGMSINNVVNMTDKELDVLKQRSPFAGDDKHGY